MGLRGGTTPPTWESVHLMGKEVRLTSLLQSHVSFCYSKARPKGAKAETGHKGLCQMHTTPSNLLSFFLVGFCLFACFVGFRIGAQG
jgi:hypothetical protein